MKKTYSISAASFSSTSTYYPLFTVFINHCGVDVKKTFAKSLYNKLRSIGLRAFLDEDELQRGSNFPSQIKRAIGTASAHVVILSDRYAESSWCLDELVMMLDSKAPIIPVFYGVTPAEVRWTRGRHAEALPKLAEKKSDEGKLRYESDTIENWRKALSRVADISDFELQAGL